MRKALAVMLTAGSLAVAVSTSFANESGSLNNGRAALQYQAAESPAVVMPSSGTDTMTATGGTLARDHETNR
jgi:hypothetical protein